MFDNGKISGILQPQANTAPAKMTTAKGSVATASSTVGSKLESSRVGDHARRLVVRLFRSPVARELLILLAFCLFTAILTWPYVTRLRDAVVDTGDPYLISWIIWWDYHATFTDPLNLFHANVFYPFRYTLAFSEHSYGTAILFFPLFAMGFRPLTVQTVALFFGFVFSGYGAFRLARTLTHSQAVGWVAGIIFAFVPYRFHTMSQLPYVFAAWIPLLFEALILFVRRRSWGRAAWLGFAFLMSGLNTISWHVLSIVPFVISAAILLTRYRLWRDRNFWLRGGLGLAAGSLLLAPFMWPYIKVSKLYGFKRSIEEVKRNSAWPIHWFSVEGRNKLWSTMGDTNPDGVRFKLFPGLLPIMFSLAAVMLAHPIKEERSIASRSEPLTNKWLRRLDIVIAAVLAMSILSIGFDRSEAFGKLFSYFTSERMLALLTVTLVARLCLAYPAFLPTRQTNLIETVRSNHRCDAFWLGLVLTVIGFCYSLGWNFFFYRICYDLIPMFRSMRVANRGAMLAYLGLALLAGLGVRRLARLANEKRPWLRPPVMFVIVCVLLLVELNAAPLKFFRGEVYPDAVTVRLKDTPMRGGIVMLPAGGDFNHRYTLRAADHMKPLIVSTSGFNSYLSDQIVNASSSGPISLEFMDLLEKVPTSYLVVHNELLPAERRPDTNAFLAWAVSKGRLRYINRFDQKNDLYAVTSTEPSAQTEASLPTELKVREWATMIDEEPLALVGKGSWTQAVGRLHIASFGDLPRYLNFKEDVKDVARGLILDVEQERQFENNFRQFAEKWTRRPEFESVYGHLENSQYVDRLIANTGVQFDQSEREALVTELSAGRETRPSTLLKIVGDKRFAEKARNRLFVLFHYFAFFNRNPDDPPDHNWIGFNFWVHGLERDSNPSKLSAAFAESFEYERINRKQ
ncbi:MAG TPA: hypothetical protein VJM12_07210 [Pyrinomonadaceae bacterium]|nr:hypothetical protein [Pyrinomonadaceae bacterium]